MKAATRLLRWLEDKSDRLSPLVVKEARQLVRGRELMLSFGVSLAVGLTIAGFGAASALSGSNTSGRWTFALLVSGLAVLGLAVVPLGAFSTLRNERLEQTLELITLTSLSPRRIVIGKLMAQVVKLTTLFAAIAPFMTMSFLLGGIDLATILVSLVALFMLSVWVSALFLLLSATSKSRAVSALVFGAVAFVGLLSIPVGRSLIFALSRGLILFPAGAFPASVPWWVFGMITSFWLASLVNIVLLAANRLSPPTTDAVTPLRLGLLLQFLLMIGWALSALGDTLPVRLSATRALLTGGTLHLAVVAYFAVTEDLAVARPVLRRMNAASRWRWLLMTFGPGGGRAVVYVLAQMCLLGAAVALLQPPTEQIRWVAVACGYICFFTGVPVLLSRRLVPASDSQLRRRVLVLLAVAVVMVVPDLVNFVVWQRDVLDLRFSLRHLINPFRTLANWSAVEVSGWIMIPAAVGLTGVVAWLRLVHVGTRDSGPSPSVIPEQAATSG